jgi:hypothetical protein
VDVVALKRAARRRALRLAWGASWGALAGVWVGVSSPVQRAWAATSPGPVAGPTAELRWGWTDDELWCRTPGGRLHGPWPREAGDPEPRAVTGGLWRPGRQGLSFLALAPERDAAPVPAFHWSRPLEDAGAPWTWAALAGGRWAAVAGSAVAGSAARLHLIDRLCDDGRVLQGRSLAGASLGAVRALAALDSRHAVLVDWTTGGQWWEVSLDPRAEPIHDGLVHDHRLGEALPSPGYRHPRRLPLAAPADSPPRLRWAAPDRPFALAQQADRGLVVHLDVRRAVLEWPLDDAAAQAPRWQVQPRGTALQVQAGGSAWRIDTARWRLERRDPLESGPSTLTGQAHETAPGSDATADGWPARQSPWRGFADQPG